jgi:hypothetical protein
MNGRNDAARRHRLAAIAARSTRPARNPSLWIRQRRQRSLISSLERGAPRVRFRTTADRRRAAHWRPHRHQHAALDGLAQRHRTRPPRLTPQSTNRRPTASVPRPRHAPHVVELRTSHHVLTQRPRPTHLDAHRIVAFMQREHVRTQSRSGGQRQRIPVGPHAESHARTGNEIAPVTVGSDAAHPDAAISVARSGHDLAAKPGDPGGMHLGINPQGNRRRPPHAPKTLTPPDATDDRHRLRPRTIQPQPACLRRHRLVPAKRPTQRPHRRNLVLANHSPKRYPRRARRPEVL